MAIKQPSYDDRIEDMHVKLNRRVNLVHLTNVCMDMKVSEFNKLEDEIEAVCDTQNKQGITDIVNRLLKM